MSAYKKIACAFVDKNILLQALTELGFEPRVLDVPEQLRGFRGDKRSQRAHIIVPKEQLDSAFTGASNDLGFHYNESTKQYDMIVSDFDIACQINQRVVQAYAKNAIKKALEDQGFEVEIPSSVNLQSKERHTIQLVGEKLI